MEPEEKVERIVRRTTGGLVRLDQRIRVNGTKRGIDVSGPYWIFGLIRVRKGRITYRRGNERVLAPRRFAMYVPPYSLTEAECIDSDSFSMGLASRRPLRGAPETPVLFPTPIRRCPESVEEIENLLRQSSGLVTIERAPRPGALSRKAKALIDRDYASGAPMSEIASKLRVSPSLLARYFKNDYGIPPVKYRQWLRVIEGMLRLMDGQAITDVAAEVGFDDLGRFYKQFKPIALSPPKTYRPER